MRLDVHQHLCSEPLVAALARRRSAPRIRREGLLWRLDLPGEPTCRIDVDGDDPERRAGLVHLDGLERALICLSWALGVEALPEDSARTLLDAYVEGVAELPETFGAWASVGLREPDPGDVDTVLAQGAAGLCLPSGALASAGALDRCGPLLERLERHRAPLFVHPRPHPRAGPLRAHGRPAGGWAGGAGYRGGGA